MTSHQSGECCTKGITHTGTAKGVFETIKDVDTYVAYPPAPTNKAIIFFTDVFGPHYLNAQLFADRYASHGYLVVVPDLFSGEALLPDDFYSGKSDIKTFLSRHHPVTIDPIANKFIDYLKNDKKIEKVAAVGYCFGAKYVVRNLNGNKLDAGYVAHPTGVTSEELKAIDKPLSIAAAEVDEIFTPENRAESEKILADLGNPWQINLYGGVSHGFAVRGDLTKKVVQFATNQAFDQAMTWFKYWL